MRVLISGSSGFIGTALVSHLESTGDDVTRLARSRSGVKESSVFWDPERGELDPANLERIRRRDPSRRREYDESQVVSGSEGSYPQQPG